MVNGQDEQRQRRSIHAEREAVRQATRHFIRSMVRAGVSVVLLPIDRLPREPRQHFQAAGREFTHGVAKLVHELANGLEEAASPSTRLEENSHADEESG